MGFLQVLWPIIGGSLIPKNLSFLAFGSPWWQAILHESELMFTMAIGNEVPVISKVFHPADWLHAFRRKTLSPLSLPHQLKILPESLIGTIFPEFLHVCKSLFILESQFCWMKKIYERHFLSLYILKYCFLA